MIEFKTKAETLLSLIPIIQSAKILPIKLFTVFEWQSNRAEILLNISREGFFEFPVIVRSSAKTEDSTTESLAGKFTSVADVLGENEIIEAVNTVINSYESVTPGDYVLIQPMLTDILLCGVAFSVDPNTGGNYIVINYDESGSTSSVTSGETDKLKTLYHFRNSPIQPVAPLNRVVELVKELEIIFNTNLLDIEFAFDRNGELYLFQVRRLCMPVTVADIETQTKIIEKIYNKINLEQGNKPYIYGSRAIYGVMPDWNPAEIIGIRPKPLALSIYKELICDSIWAYQRDNYGYKNLRSFPLLIDFAGIPFIDVRVSFNSFLPKELDNCLSEKLINYYLERLAENPELHDKVEFEIVYSCNTFNLEKRLQILENYGFSENEIYEIKEGLKRITNKIIALDDGLLIRDIAKIRELEERRETILNSDLDTASRIYWLLEDCKRYGTLPFAGLARGGFVAVSILKSMVSVGVLANNDYQDFIGGLDTVSSKMSVDFESLSQKEFLEKYGHLRPGTYDILSKRYDQAPEKYFDFSKSNSKQIKTEKNIFSLSLSQLNKIKELLETCGFVCDVLQLFDFIKMAIEGREYSKFIFTKSLSAALSLFEELALENGFSVEDAAFADIMLIHECYSSAGDVKDKLTREIERGKAKYINTQYLNLPPLIVNADEVYSFFQLDCQPNFITLKNIQGDISNINSDNLSGKILLIESADPGYDWIFSKEISGFITMYGGVNSHMAIRAGELQIPAIIGAGEKLYHHLLKAKRIELNCAERTVRVLR